MDLKLLWLYLIVINIITFTVFVLDKKRAKRGSWRIKERTLLALVFIGGSLGAIFAMLMMRHKTQKLRFTLSVPITFILHTLIIWFLTKI